MASLKEQKAFEKSVHEKTKRGGGTSRRISARDLLVTRMVGSEADDIREWLGIGDINPLPPHLVLTKSTTDLHFHIVGPLATSNEVQLSLALNAFNDAVSLLLRGQVEKRSVLEGLDMVLLAADETIDDG